MQKLLLLLPVFSLVACQNETIPLPVLRPEPFTITPTEIQDTTSWAYFLQHLPEKEGAIVDFTGKEVPDQLKKFTLIHYDVGSRDLQQCADALIRLRAEYLFRRQHFSGIGFHFTNGTLYTFTDYVSGMRPVARGNKVSFIRVPPAGFTHRHLRNYLDLVYAYAGTISLARDLKDADAFDIGTVVVTPGSPGHCFIITNKATTSSGDTLYKLVEGFSPAQSIYVLRNLDEPQLGYWHRLTKGVIRTASYTFRTYRLKTFE